MTDVPTNPEMRNGALVPRPNLPGLSAGISIGAIARIVGQAYLLAYAAPYGADKPPPPVSNRAEDGRGEAGRDPNW